MRVLDPGLLEQGETAPCRRYRAPVVDAVTLELDLGAPSPCFDRAVAVVINVRLVECHFAAVFGLDATGVVNVIAVELDFRTAAVGYDGAMALVVDVRVLELYFAMMFGRDATRIVNVVMLELDL